MLSLTEQLANFSQNIKQGELQNKLKYTIHNPSNNGITIQQLLEENKIVLTQISKMKQLFANYFKLNDKLYKNILQHQIDFNTQSSKISTLSANLQAKVEQSISAIKQIYQKAWTQNRNVQNIVNQLIQPLKQELNNKVDQNRIKILICQANEKQVQKMIIESKAIKKAQQQQQLNKLQSVINQKNQQIQLQIKTINATILNYQNKLTIVSSQLKQKSNQIINIKLNNQYKNNQIAQIKQINYKMDNSINNIQNKIDQYITKKVQQLKSFIQNQIKVYNQQNIQTQFLILKNKVIQQDSKLQNQIRKLDKCIDICNIMVQQHYQQLCNIKQRFNLTIQQRKIKQQSDHKFLIQKINVIQKKYQQLLHIVNQNKSQTQIELNILHQKIQYSCLKNQQTLMKKLNKQISNIVKQNNQRGKELKEILKCFKVKLQDNQRNFDYVRDLISQKANFTDLVLYSDQKVNKTQIQQLKQTFIHQQLFSKSINVNIQQNSLQKTLQKKNYKKRQTTNKFRIFQEMPKRLLTYSVNQNKTKNNRKYSFSLEKKLLLNRKTSNIFE